MMFRALLLGLWLLLGTAQTASADEPISLEELDPNVEWRVRSLEVEGHEHFSTREIESHLRTRVRPWYLPWKALPRFDASVFERDLERLRRLYEADGFFACAIEAQAFASAGNGGNALALAIRVEEGARALVSGLQLWVDGAELEDAERIGSLPLREGQPFLEALYQEGERKLRRNYLNRGRAHVQVTRRADVSLDRRQVLVTYTVETGPSTVFGATTVEGLQDVAQDIVERELRYAAGEAFSLQKIEETRRALLALKLFARVRVDWQREAGTPDTAPTAAPIPIAIHLAERPPRVLEVGVGYSTETQVGARLSWRHFNWLGGGRHLYAAAKYSIVTTSADLDFLQPHLFARENRGLLSLRLFKDSEDTYTLDSVRLMPRFERDLTPNLTVWAGYRVQAAKLRDVGQPVDAFLGSVRRDGLLSGPAVGLDWNGGLEGTRFTLGTRYSLRATQIGEIWGGDYQFYTITNELAHSLSVGYGVELALRLRLSLADALGDEQNIPLFERLFAGGEASVRGFGRRELGPKTASGDPVGGLTRFEASFEVRRKIWGNFGAIAFVDAGQVSLDRFDVPLKSLEYAAGPGLTYDTPVGPLSLYVGFPLDPPDQQTWEIHFSVGYFF